MRVSKTPRAPAFALTVPGIGPILREEARALGIHTGRVEFDGRADVVPLVGGEALLAALRTAEDVFAQVAFLPRANTARATAAAIDRNAVERLGARGSFRVVTRVLSEPTFRRAALRDAVISRISTLRPRWEARPDGDVEVWVLQTSRHGWRVGVRRPGLGTRSRPPRLHERPGALRPAVAAAMVRAAGPAKGILLDPCCGSGTILAEAAAIGWTIAGGDVDPDAIAAAEANMTAALTRLDARCLPIAAAGVGAVVSNLPFGEQYRVQGALVAWYRRVLSEAGRVAPTVVVLAPPSRPFRHALGRLPFELTARHDIELQGRKASIWVLQRQAKARAVSSATNLPL